MRLCAPSHPPHILRVFITLCTVFAGAALGKFFAHVSARALVICRRERKEVKFLRSFILLFIKYFFLGTKITIFLSGQSPKELLTWLTNSQLHILFNNRLWLQFRKITSIGL